MCDIRPSPNNLARHIKTCSLKWKKYGNNQQEIYHGGEEYKPPLDIFEEIENVCNVDLPKKLREIHFLATFDSETYFEMYPQPVLRGEKMETLSRMYPFVIGVCSNVPGYENAKLFWLSDSDESFVETFIEYLISISKKQQDLLDDLLEPVFDLLHEKMESSEKNNNVYGQ